MKADLHCHSTYSDGSLPPEKVVQRAKIKGVELLALTDHDELGGLSLAQQKAQALQLNFVNGVEISTFWRDTSIHVVGLAIDQHNSTLKDALSHIRDSRQERGKEIARNLERVGIADAWQHTLTHTTNPQLIGRKHFAEFLHAAGHASSIEEAFARYLSPGCPGYAPLPSATVAQAVEWIHAAGGLAVLAHPGRYPPEHIPELLKLFRDLEGEAIEVCTSSHTRAHIEYFSNAAIQLKFLASRGSDFHKPGKNIELNRVPALPAHLTPIWSRW